MTTLDMMKKITNGIEATFARTLLSLKIEKIADGTEAISVVIIMLNVKRLLNFSFFS